MENLTGCRNRSLGFRQHSLGVSSWRNSPTVGLAIRLALALAGGAIWRNSLAVRLGHRARVSSRHPLEEVQPSWRNVLAVRLDNWAHVSTCYPLEEVEPSWKNSLAVT